MRSGVRAAVKAGHERIAVICGAWHVPAITEPTTVKADTDLLRGLPTVKTRVTWVPWTSQRLTHASGYGAGVVSPGWYAHLWRAPDQISAQMGGQGRGPAAPGRPARLHRRRPRGSKARRGSGRRAGPVAARADRADRRGAVDPVPRRRHSAPAHHQQAGDRRGTRRGAAGCAGRTAAGRFRGPVPAAPVPAGRGRPGHRTRPAQGERTQPVQAAAPAAAARRALGHGHDRER